ncbi:MAG: hypothetical protein IVW55_06540 [Chloroflexi bacterium]|nr:hypothetical protein [Chloroflexota bacterium]
MDFKRSTLEEAGFTSFVPIQALGQGKLRDVPQKAGVYVVLREHDSKALFLDVNPGGWFNGDPTVSKDELVERWVSNAHVIYIGKGSGAKGLYQRMRQFIRFGQGHVIGHRGGHYVWQVEQSQDFVIAWKLTEPTQTARDLELELFREFESVYGSPFANLTR